MSSSVHDIFISYSSKDYLWVSKLAHILELCGYSVWWDRQLLPGQNFHEDIQNALDKTRCVVTIWSENSVKSNWVLGESSQAQERNILVPVIYQNVRIPTGFKSLHNANLASWNGDVNDDDFRRLLRGIDRVLGDKINKKVERKQLINKKILLISVACVSVVLFSLIYFEYFYFPKDKKSYLDDEIQLPSLDYNDNYNETILKLKEYIEVGNDIIYQFDGLIDNYESALISFRDYRDDCRRSPMPNLEDGAIFQKGKIVCSSQTLEKFQTRLKESAVKLDGLEKKLSYVKEKIALASLQIKNIERFNDVNKLIKLAESKLDEAKKLSVINQQLDDVVKKLNVEE